MAKQMAIQTEPVVVFDRLLSTPILPPEKRTTCLIRNKFRRVILSVYEGVPSQVLAVVLAHLPVSWDQALTQLVLQNAEVKHTLESTPLTLNPKPSPSVNEPLSAQRPTPSYRLKCER